MIGQGLTAFCPRCGKEEPCVLRERVNDKGFNEYYLDCHLCYNKFTNSDIDQENKWYQKEQEMARKNGIFLVVKGEPVPQGRPRFASVKGKFIHAYENLIKWHIRRFQTQYPNVPLLKENIFFELKVFRPIPASFSKKKRELIAQNKLFPNTKPDTDNLQKLLKDCMTKSGCRKDDALVASEIAEKFRSDVSGIYIHIEELEEN